MVGYQCDELNDKNERKNSRPDGQEEARVLCIGLGVISAEKSEPKMAYGFWHVIILCLLSAISGILFYRAATSIVKYISENQNEHHAEISNDAVHLQQGK